MANLVTLAERIEKAKAKISKIEGTKERHQKQLVKKVDAFNKKFKGLNEDLSNVEELKMEHIKSAHASDDYATKEVHFEASGLLYDVIRKLSDIKDNQKKLDEENRKLAKHETIMDAEKVREGEITEVIPQAIIDFMDEWEKKVTAFHFDKYENAEQIKSDVKYHLDRKYENIFGDRKDRIRYKEIAQVELDSAGREKALISEMGALVFRAYNKFEGSEEGKQFISEHVAFEKKEKIVSLLYRIREVTGKITDGTRLRIGMDGNINGVVYGENGNAEVETIGAGGYNIQIYHYRVLVKKFYQNV